MLFSSSVFTALAAFLVQRAQADCQLIGGNYYCSETTAIAYDNIGYSGSYSDVTNMDESSCKCSQDSVSFSGSMSPLDEELSVHFRGPLKLSQFAVYYPASGSKSSKKAKRDQSAETCTTTQHVHHVHKRAAAVEYVDVTSTVYANAGNGAAATSGAQDAQPSASASSSVAQGAQGDSTSSSAASSASGSSSSASSGDWVRSSYYTPGTATNVTFLNTLGGTDGSGTWSSCFGNSLSYCASDGKSGASSAQTLDDVTIESNTEFLVMSSSECGDSSASGDCGYYRSGIPAFHGFGGADKIFFFEFQMPTDSSASGSNPDMPAIWLLNAKIPRTLQYGDSSCSCWSTGCGELDLFEILSQGSDKLISHLHDGQGDNGSSQGGGGSQDYFARPVEDTMSAVAVFSGSTVMIAQLDNSTSLGSTISESTVNSWLSQSASTADI